MSNPKYEYDIHELLSRNQELEYQLRKARDKILHEADCFDQEETKVYTSSEIAHILRNFFDV